MNVITFLNSKETEKKTVIAYKMLHKNLGKEIVMGKNELCASGDPVMEMVIFKLMKEAKGYLIVVAS